MTKIKKSVLLVFLLIGAMIFLNSCAEDESPVQPSSPISVVIIAGPSGDVPHNAYVTFKWQGRGGSGTYTSYTYKLGSNAEVTTSATSVTFENLTTTGDYTFSVKVTDNAGTTSSEATRTFTIIADDVEPDVSITHGPAEGAKVAENNSVTFSWSATDSSVFGQVRGYTYSLVNSTAGTTHGTTTEVLTTTVSFDSLASGSYAFTVNVFDIAGKSASAVVNFSVMPANILFIDDHALGGPSPEFRELNEWKAAFEGFAWKEFDMDANYTLSGAVADMLEAEVNGAGSSVETIVWDESGTDDYYMLWYSSNGIGTRTPWLLNFLDNGGNVVLIGSNLMGQIYNSVPPADGDFEPTYMAMDTVSAMSVDTTVTQSTIWDPSLNRWVVVVDTSYDTTYTDPWLDDDYVTLTGENGYTDISIDVLKDPSTHQAGLIFPGLDDTKVKPIMLDDDTGEVVSYVATTPAGGKMVVLGMNLYFSPTREIKDVIQKILSDEFGH